MSGQDKQDKSNPVQSPAQQAQPEPPALPEPKPLQIDPQATHSVLELKYEVPLTTLRVDPTSRFVAAGAQNLEIQLWDLQSGARQTLQGHKSWVRSLEFSENGERLYSACWGGQINVWDLTATPPKLIQTIDAHEGSARWVRTSPDGKRLATCGNDLLVKVWDVLDGKLVEQFAGHKRHVYGVDFHPAGQHLVSQDLMGVIKVWNLKTGNAERTIDASVMTGYDKKFAADMGGARDMQFSPDGSRWASAGITNVSNSFAGIQDPIIMVFDWKTGKPLQQFKAADSFKGIAWGVRFHPDGFIVGAGADRSGKGELWFFKMGEEKPFHTLKLAKAARGLDLLADHRRLVLAHVDGVVRVYHMTAKV